MYVVTDPRPNVAAIVCPLRQGRIPPRRAGGFGGLVAQACRIPKIGTQDWKNVALPKLQSEGRQWVINGGDAKAEDWFTGECAYAKFQGRVAAEFEASKQVELLYPVASTPEQVKCRKAIERAAHLEVRKMFRAAEDAAENVKKKTQAGTVSDADREAAWKAMEGTWQAFDWTILLGRLLKGAPKVGDAAARLWAKYCPTAAVTPTTPGLPGVVPPGGAIDPLLSPPTGVPPTSPLYPTAPAGTREGALGSLASAAPYILGASAVVVVGALAYKKLGRRRS